MGQVWLFGIFGIFGNSLKSPCLIELLPHVLSDDKVSDRLASWLKSRKNLRLFSGILVGFALNGCFAVK